MSKHLNARHVSGLNKVGDFLCPGDTDFPSFSQSGRASQVDRLLDHMPAQDVSDLKLLLFLFSLMPRWLVAFKLGIIERMWELGFPMGGVLRLIRLGLRGLVMSLYYSGDLAHKALGYEVKVYLEE